MENSNFVPNDYYLPRTPSSTNCDYNYLESYGIPSQSVDSINVNHHQQQHHHQQQLHQLQQPQQQSQHHHQIYHQQQQSYLDPNLQDYGYNQAISTSSIPPGTYNNYTDCNGGQQQQQQQQQDIYHHHQINQLSNHGANQFNHDNYVDPSFANYIENGNNGSSNNGTMVSNVNQNFSPNDMKTGQRQGSEVKEERLSSSTSSTNPTTTTKEEAKVCQPVKSIRKKKQTRKKEVNKKTASGYAHFFREKQPLIKRMNPEASFGEVSKIVAAQWETLSEDAKAIYKRKAEEAKNCQFKEVALTHAMAVATNLAQQQQQQQQQRQQLQQQQQNQDNQVHQNIVPGLNGGQQVGNLTASLETYQQDANSYTVNGQINYHQTVADGGYSYS